ncbi:WecB/TagA/CpsF family glycosyltransferase [Acidobacteriota bacterium]
MISELDKIPFAGIHIDNLSQEEALDKIRELLKSKHLGYVVTPNAQHINILQNDKEFKKIYDEAALVLADGMSIVFSLKILGQPLKEKCSGADLFNNIIRLAAAQNKKLFILGGINGSEKIAEEKAGCRYPNLHIQSYSPPRGFEHNSEETQSILQKIIAHETDVLLVCVGSPKSEKWIYRNQGVLNGCLSFIVGDSVNFFAGIKKRAPKWMRKSGLEWLYRLAKEPHRLWRRYLIGNTRFALIFFRELWNRLNKKSEIDS